MIFSCEYLTTDGTDITDMEWLSQLKPLHPPSVQSV